MSKSKNSKNLFLANVVRSEPIPYKRIFKDLNRYNRKQKFRKDYDA